MYINDEQNVSSQRKMRISPFNEKCTKKFTFVDIFNYNIFPPFSPLKFIYEKLLQWNSVNVEKHQCSCVCCMALNHMLQTSVICASK